MINRYQGPVLQLRDVSFSYTGKKNELTIGSEGGKLESSDGYATLIIPEGAVSKKTNFSILPLTNEMPNGNGKAYRLEPSGINFRKPVQLVLKYDEEERQDTSQLLMGIAMQDASGQWMALQKFTIDTVAKRLIGNINHFSDWSKFDAIQIKPYYARINVDNMMTLEVIGVQPISCDDESQLCALEKRPKKVIWKVNEITGGNGIVGTINGRMLGAYYKAPAKVPANNPVAVKADLVGLTFWFNKQLFKNLSLVSNVLVYDNAYEVKMVSRQEVGTATYIDTGSFVVAIDGESGKLVEKVNKNITDELEYLITECTYVLINPGANHGNIHITGAKHIKVTPAKAPDFPSVEISFIASPMVYSTFRFTCRDSKGKPFVKTSEAATGRVAQSSAMPLFIKFVAKKGEQKLVDMPIPGGYYRVTVKQLNDE
ncbi:MAG: hypothetical protein EOO04_34475 [Chitinophagaceae bacterium]|nr:MAG: hypothetical protein EOO04_34475 [Chitinophagaceae bacterium]